MSNNYFKFKKFTIEQDGCAMKVGTDGCLLGAWFSTENCNRILDIGAGTGLISIMAAQRSEAYVTGLEIDSTAAAKATENAKNSPWNERIEIINADLRTFESDIPFDAIVSNPPYINESALVLDWGAVISAIITFILTAVVLFAIVKIFAKAKDLLATNGKISIIVPTDAFNEWTNEAIIKGFTATRITHIKTTPKKTPKRTLIELQPAAGHTLKEDTLILEKSPGVYSQEARELLRDFYLKID